MKVQTRRDFLNAVLTLGASGFFLAGCETLDSVAKVVGNSDLIPVSTSQLNSLFKAGKAVAKSFESFTPEQEYYIGRTISTMVLEKYPAFENVPANYYLNVVGQTLAAASDRPATFGGYRFQIQNSKEINAFAAPGGFIFVTRGLLHCCRDEDALAGVLAHEIGHVQENHGLKAIRQSRITDALTIIGTEGANQFGSRELKTMTGIFSDTITDITRTLIVNGYSRSQERDADFAAVKILQRIGYSPQGLMQMLDQMKGRIKSGTPDFAKTHPAPKERIAYLEPSLGAYLPYNSPKQRKKRFNKFIALV